MSIPSPRPPRRTLSETGRTPTVMADAFARADLNPSDFPPGSSPTPELQSRQSPEHARDPIRCNGSRFIPFGEFDERHKLDLHGCNRDQAYELLKKFIGKRHVDGVRYVLVITGKGSGMLKRLVPQWLQVAPFKEFVAGTRVADPWNGGEGARYVHLH